MLISSTAHANGKKLQDLNQSEWTNMRQLPLKGPIRAQQSVLIVSKTNQLSISLTFFHVCLWKQLKEGTTQSAQKRSHYVEEHLSPVSSITVTERAVQIITFYLLHERLLHKLAQDFPCAVAAGCLETRQEGKEHCGSYLPIKGTTRASTHFAFVTDWAFFNGTNCTDENLPLPCFTLKLWANYFHLRGNMSSLCTQK